jgi:hypothetical protein
MCELFMDLSKPVSGRQFAKMVGLSETAVRKAVERRSIVAGKTPEGKFIPEVAAEEWGQAILPEYTANEKAPAAKVVTAIAKAVNIKANPAKRTRDKKENSLPVTAEEFLKEDDGELPDDITEEEIKSEPLKLTDSSTKVDADRVQAIYKAKMAELAYQERRGDMIPRVKMKVLFEYGANIRSAIQGLKSRVLDDILANAHDRQLASMIFEEAIDKTLEELSDPEKLNI